MDLIRSLFKNSLTVLVGGIVLGLFLGLVIGWGIWPVKWVNAAPNALSPEWRADFLRMAIASYNQIPDSQLAQDRFKALGKEADKTLLDVSKNPKGLDPNLISQFASMVGSQAPAAGVQTTPLPGATLAPGMTTEPGATIEPFLTPGAAGETKEEKEGGLSGWLIPLLLCLVVLLVAFVAAYFLFFRNKFSKSSTTVTPATQAAQARKDAVLTDYTTTAEAPPISQFMASYRIGDDLFDDSFSIDTQNGEFLGECGVGISETIDGGDPKKVSALEVWLFDKNDIQTVTKVLMSAAAFDDPNTRARLESKGEHVLAEPGKEFYLETRTLTMIARVVEMGYGSDATLPSESYFDHMLIELALWQKAAE